MPLLATPFTVTTTGPVVAPLGTGATMLVALQLVGVAVVPLKRTLLLPCVDPKFVPVIVTDVPTAPDVGDRLVRVGGWLTSVTVHVKVLLLERAPSDAVAGTVYVPALVKVSVPEIKPVGGLTLSEAGSGL